METIQCNTAIERILIEGNQHIGERFESDVIFIKAPMQPPVDDMVKREIEQIRRSTAHHARKLPDRLTVFVETRGGYVETVERIVSVFRKHYAIVEYVVPNYAYSAGTILVLSGDELYMDYYSVLGPIDPQIEMDGGGGTVTGMAYLAKFEELLNTINDPERSPEETRGQLQYLIRRFDPGKLFTIEQAIEHSKSLLKDWLPRYKFKSWTTKETTGERVSAADREERAGQIAEVLGNVLRWHSHGRGVGIRELASEEIKLKVINYGDDEALSRDISQYYGLFVDYLAKNEVERGIHSRLGVRRFQ